MLLAEEDGLQVWAAQGIFTSQLAAGQHSVSFDCYI